MLKKICLITGASSGIGKEAALELASQFHVVLICRNPQKAERVLTEIQRECGSNAADLLVADLSSQTEIRNLIETISKRYPAIHVLINNAGAVFAKRQLSVDGIEMTLATNHLGPFLLNLGLLDLLKATGASRILNVSSEVHKWGRLDFNDLQFERRKYGLMRVYAQSKLLMTAATFELAKKLQGTGVSVNCLHPGAVKTALGSNNTNSFSMKLMDKIIKSFLISPKDAAQKNVVGLATASEAEIGSGNYFVKGKPARHHRLCDDPVFREKVWKISEQLVKVARH